MRVDPWRQSPALSLPERWDALASHACEPNPFFERWALKPALEQFDGDESVLLFTLLDQDELVGLMPLTRSRDYYDHAIPHVSIWLHHNAFCGAPLVATGYETIFWSSLLEWADSSGNLVPFLHLAGLPAGGQLHTALRDVARLQGRPATIVQEDERALLVSDLSPEDYFAQSMSSKKRKELRRQHKRLSEQGDLVFLRWSDAEGIDEWISSYLALEQAGWKGKQSTALADAAQTRTFFADALAGAAHAGRLERLSLELDGRQIAMLASFITPPGAYSFKTTFDEEYARFSPGVLLQRENLALLDQDDIAWCDSCAAADHPMIERIWREKRTILRVNVALGGMIRRHAMRALARIETGSFPKGL
ncbi:GNAT family N-acetyltransferase [Erythrobacter jejuensis]|uniref:GNAT family N-acetyltransferase n=1 Tax=Parerythrobacter jejuensis TaxID=795812 RepID=A0A845AQX3_9SPHN|nr:GNAT family N-acetyltransferase [Parerythrobacter jejuensis]